MALLSVSFLSSRKLSAVASALASRAMLGAALGFASAFAASSIAMASIARPSAPEKMDAETHTIVIQKLENVLKSAKEDETLSMSPIRSRLADLYSERARLRAMDEAAANCQACTGASEDRKRALSLYQEVVKGARPNERGDLLMQKAHLHEMQRENAKALAIYDSIVASPRSAKNPNGHRKELVAQAYMGRGELRFAKGEFGKAKPDFEAAQRLSPPEGRGYAMYRAAWCELNLGRQPKATGMLLKLLKSPELLTRPSTAGPQFDAAFQEDVSRDLAAFLARGPVGRREIATLVNASPESAKRENVRYLAKECERLGSRASALIAWDAFIATDANDDDRLEAMIHVAQIRYAMGDKEKSVTGMRLAADHWRQVGCKAEAEQCDLFRQQLRRVPIEWNKAEKKKPTSLLLASYKAYLSKFDQDAEMTHWAALIARDLKQPREASALFFRASVLTAQSLAANKLADGSGRPADAEATKSSKEILEASLVGAIEMAEHAKDVGLREQAYNHYLQINPLGARANDVRYQRARLPYETGNYQGASVRLHEFAASAQCRAVASRVGGRPKAEASAADAQTLSGAKQDEADLCGKAADLDLDALAALKQDALIEARAKEYASIYPTRSSEYAEMARKAALNQVARKTNDPSVDSPSEVRAALEKLDGVSLAGASREDQISYWKNRIKLAERGRDLVETERSADGLLAVKGLSEEDREYGMSRKEWAAEMKLDFQTAYRVSLKMKMPKLSQDERLMRLALLAELAGRSPRQHQDEFLRTTRDRSKALATRAKMVRDARNPMAELRRQGAELERAPQIYAPLALEIFARTQDYGFAQRALKARGVAQQPAGQALGRYLFLRDFQVLQRSLAGHRIRSSSDALLGRTLSERIRLLGQAEDFAGRAIRAGDWTLQLATLATLSRENARLYSEIMRLPVPRQLQSRKRAHERSRYMALVAQRARPFKEKHDQIEEKLGSFWADSRSLEDAARSYERTRRELRPLLAKDLQAIASVAPNSVSRRLKAAMADDGRSMARELSEARGDVQRRPFDARYLHRLRQLEEENGREPMVAYLDARISQLRQGESR